jgi:hypothetical protein
MKKSKHILFIVSLLLSSFIAKAQIDTILFTESASHFFPSFPYKSSFASLIDRNGSAYLYSANMEAGLGIYDLSTAGQILPVLNMSISNFDSLDISCLKQRNNSLFLGIGDFQTNTNHASGLAILDVSDPAAPLLKDLWDSTAFTHGISHLLIQDDFAYLSTMSEGMFILDISDETDIHFVSHLQLDLNFPAPSPNAHNGRGLKYRNDTLFVCFDRGGLRVVDVTDKNLPVEVYSYINTILNSTAAAAYNDVYLKDSYAFISVDYCGLEIIDISTIPFTNVQWYNPWGCGPTNWSGAPNHFNELKTSRNDSILFISTGQSEVLAFDISDPANTIFKGSFGEVNDSLATYGLDVFNDLVSLSYVRTAFHIPPFTPFFSDPGGLRTLDFSVSYNNTGIEDLLGNSDALEIFPNPTNKKTSIRTSLNFTELSLRDAFGRHIKTLKYEGTQNIELDLSSYSTGIYFLSIQLSSGLVSKRLIIQ